MSDDRPGYLSVSLRGLALSSTIVALTCLVTLAVVVTIDEVDVLSTVALALAILAFVVQIIVFIVQGATANQQMLQSQQLYGQTQELLTQIGEKTAGTHEALTRIDQQMLQHILGKTLPQAAESDADINSPEFQRQLAEDVVGLMGVPGSQEFVNRFPPPPAPEEANRLRRELETFADEPSTRAALKELKSLPDYALSQLERLGRDHVSTFTPPLSIGPGLTMNPDPALSRLEAVEKVPGHDVYILTDRGRELVRSLTARGEPPAAAKDEIETLQDRIRRFRDATQALSTQGD